MPVLKAISSSRRPSLNLTRTRKNSCSAVKVLFGPRFWYPGESELLGFFCDMINKVVQSWAKSIEGDLKCYIVRQACVKFEGLWI